jgi:sterol desaturase/sphingolipid hydroxylase (fatty acid hydroxylase superfamily)
MAEWIPAGIRRFADHGMQMYMIEASRYLVAAGSVTVLLWLAKGWTLPRRIQNRMAGWDDRRREFVNSAITIGIFALTSIYIFAMIDAGIYSIPVTSPPLWLGLIEIAGMVIGHDAYFYWMHRGLHHRTMFRRAHLEHHLSRTPTPWAAYSFAPIEALFEAAFVPLVLLLTPIHAVVLVAFVLHQIVRNVIGHMGHELAWPGFTRSRWTGWLTTTTHHDLHHSQGAYNFGLYFTWWDRWMGTEHPRYHEAFETAAIPWFGRKDEIAPNAPIS